MNVECCADSSERLPSGHLVRNAVLIAVCFILGCDARIETFLPNRVFSLSLEKTRGTSAERATEDARRVVQELYGTPELQGLRVKYEEFSKTSSNKTSSY